ncbi:MAG: DUF5054 domain-containing protein [Capsulimonadaceae bacterium]|nr:DUF5054 domain-containing protein [Capsulimonadaceae bacterium]
MSPLLMEAGQNHKDFAQVESGQTVHLVFKTHLDLGFTDLARSVEDQYIDSFIPQAIALARSIREAGQRDRFVWTTGSWLVYRYLERVTGAKRVEMEQAIAHGDIVWHALPFTTHSELMDPDLFAYGLSLSRRLDARFGRTTLAGKMTDVPGHTRAIVPLLADAGVEFLHIGVNPACPVPAVPPIFRWRDEGAGADVTVMYNPDYGTPSHVPGSGEILWVASTGDNLGPHSPAAIQAKYDECRRQIPGASVTATSLDDFARAIRPVIGALPVVTDEIGDTWIHGAGSDPAKMASFRELLSLRRGWLANGRCPSGGLDGFHEELLKVTEHTWGLDEKTHLNDYTAYSRPDFEAARSRPQFRLMEESWQEQRGYVQSAVQRLADSGLAAEATAALAKLTPVLPRTDGLRELRVGEKVDIGRYAIEIDEATGAISRMLDRITGTAWATRSNPLCLLKYQVFGSRDYDRFLNQFVRPEHLRDKTGWAVLDLSKPGLERASPRGASWYPSLRSAHVAEDDRGVERIVIELALPDECVRDFGAPRIITVEVSRAGDDALDVTLQWFDKPASRIPEALWFSFTPDVTDWGRWELQKMQRMVTPNAVVSKGARRLHAVSGEAVYSQGDRTFRIETLDAPLIAVGDATLLDFDDRIASASEGVHVNLYNNVWGTNFPMWNGDDARFRFRVGSLERRASSLERL